MQEANCMKPYNCQPSNNIQKDTNTIENKLKQFNLRHPPLQLHFNTHDCYHIPSCFKRGPECKTELPKRNTPVAAIHFDNDKCITWYFIDSSIKKVAPFKYIPKRNICDQFININNYIATTVLACNNNVTTGDKACFFM